MEPWWKRRMEEQVKQLNKDFGHKEKQEKT